MHLIVLRAFTELGGKQHRQQLHVLSSRTRVAHLPCSMRHACSKVICHVSIAVSNQSDLSHKQATRALIDENVS